MIRLLFMKLFLAMIFLFAPSLQVMAATSAEIRSQIQGQMAQRHPGASGPFWTSLGPEALPIIKEMYGETKSVFEKSWLIDGMGYFSDPSVGTLLESEIQSSGNSVVTKKMLSALIQSQGNAVLEFVEPWLKDEDPHLRLAVAENMKKYMDSELARQRLQDFEAREKLAWVKEAMKESQKKDGGPNLLKRNESSPTAQTSPVFPPLGEKAWVGEWKGQYLGAGKVTSGSLFLTLLDEKAATPDQKWKMELKLDALVKFEIKAKELEIVYYQTARLHWLEVRNKKEDKVFIGQRP